MTFWPSTLPGSPVETLIARHADADLVDELSAHQRCWSALASNPNLSETQADRLTDAVQGAPFSGELLACLFSCPRPRSAADGLVAAWTPALGAGLPAPAHVAAALTNPGLTPDTVLSSLRFRRRPDPWWVSPLASNPGWDFSAGATVYAGVHISVRLTGRFAAGMLANATVPAALLERLPVDEALKATHSSLSARRALEMLEGTPTVAAALAGNRAVARHLFAQLARSGDRRVLSALAANPSLDPSQLSLLLRHHEILTPVLAANPSLAVDDWVRLASYEHLAAACARNSRYFGLAPVHLVRHAGLVDRLSALARTGDPRLDVIVALADSFTGTWPELVDVASALAPAPAS